MNAVPLPRLFNSFIEEYRFRKSSLNEYRNQIHLNIMKTVDVYFQEQNNIKIDTQSELSKYVKKFSQLYNETLQSIKYQQEAMQEINRGYIRPKRIDESLDDFRKLYNESLFPSFIKKSSLQINTFSKAKDEWFISDWFLSSLFNSNIKNKNTLSTSWSLLIQVTSDGVKNAEKVVSNTMNELIQFQKELSDTVQLVKKESEELFPLALNKNDIRIGRNIFENQIKKIEYDSSKWIDDRLAQLESTLKLLQEKVNATDSMYEELIGKRKAKVQFAVMNDVTMKKVLDMIDTKNKDWTHIKTEDGVEVYRKFTVGSRYACVKCHGVIDSSPKAVFELFEDDTRTPEYNSFYEKGRDIEYVAENTKVSWACTPAVFPFKPRDFVTIIHFRKLGDGTMVVLNRAGEHPNAPNLPPYVRGSIILAANIIQPIQGKPNHCKLTMITQMDPGGFAPAPFVNKICTFGPIGFMQNVKVAAKKKKPSPKQAEGEDEKKKFSY
eukprot:gene7887-10703_t